MPKKTVAVATKETKKEVQREIKYPEIKVKVHGPDNPITVAKARELMGLETETDKVKFGADYLCQDRLKRKVRCFHNSGNRPFYQSLAETYMQEHLNRNWRLNGETIIVGEYGTILSGQHTLIGLDWAEQERHKQEEFWAERGWPGPVTMEKIIVYGISEEPDVANTIDTPKPRSLADVIYRSGYFPNMKDDSLQAVSRMTQYAIHMVRHRVGSRNTFGSRMRVTHAESLDFLNRHLRILKCVKHIWEENKSEKGNSGTRISRYLSPGKAAGMCYLMGASASDLDDYRLADPEPSENKIDWANWDKAQEFWVLLGSEAEEFGTVKNFFDKVLTSEASVNQRVAALAKAWLLFLGGEEITGGGLKLKYRTEDGREILDECPSVGGIDQGNPEFPDDDVTEPVPSAEEIEQQTAIMREAKLAAKRNGKKPISQTVAESGAKGGKPPAPKLKDTIRGQSRKQIEAEQTRKAKEADEQLAKEGK